MTFVLREPAVFFLLPFAFLPFFPSRGKATPFSSLAPLDPLKEGWMEWIHRLRPWMASLTLLLLILALSRPVLCERMRETVRKGVDIMLALDVSASMGATDVPPDRMHVARKTAADFLARRGDDRVGVVLFSGIPYLLSPPTLERSFVVSRLLEVRADRLGSGTAIGDALAAAMGRLKDSPAQSRVLVLLTDGTSNRGKVSPLAAARVAAALGIRIYTIGFGSLEGGEVPLALERHPDRRKQPVIDRLEEEPLREIARLSGGRYFRAGSGEALYDIYRRIDALEKSPLEIVERLDETPLAPPFAFAAASFLAIEIFLFGICFRRSP